MLFTNFKKKTQIYNEIKESNNINYPISKLIMENCRFPMLEKSSKYIEQAYVCHVILIINFFVNLKKFSHKIIRLQLFRAIVTNY